MPLIILGALTILILAIAVWATNTQESDPTLIGEGEPDWGPNPSRKSRKNIARQAEDSLQLSPQCHRLPRLHFNRTGVCACSEVRVRSGRAISLRLR